VHCCLGRFKACLNHSRCLRLPRILGAVLHAIRILQKNSSEEPWQHDSIQHGRAGSWLKIRVLVSDEVPTCTPSQDLWMRYFPAHHLQKQDHWYNNTVHNRFTITSTAASAALPYSGTQQKGIIQEVTTHKRSRISSVSVSNFKPKICSSVPKPSLCSHLVGLAIIRCQVKRS